MSQYDDLDAAILRNLDTYGNADLTFVGGGDAGREAQRIAKLTGRDVFRVLDGRLQSLRKRGVIAFDHKTGWSKT